MSDQSVNVLNPAGDLVSIPQDQLSQAMDQGYKQPSDQDIQSAQKEQTYGTLGQQALTAVEGAGNAATFGAFPAIEKATGLTTGPDIEARRETNPGVHALGQVAGVVSNPLGATSAMESAGVAGAEALGQIVPLAATKVGSAAAKAAIENMVYSGSDEVAKMLGSDPGKASEFSLTNVGLSGLLGAGVGGALGSVSPLWKATMGAKTGGVLKAVADKVGGIDNVIPDSLRDAINVSGIEMDPVVKAGLSDDPAIKQAWLNLQQSKATGSAQEAQESFSNFHKTVGDKLVESLGKNPLEIPEEISKYEVGKNLGETLHDEFKAKVDPTAEQFEAIKSKYADKPILGKTINDISDGISNLVSDQRWNLSDSSDVMKEVNRVLKDLPNIKSLGDLSAYQTIIGDNTYDITNPALSRAGQLLKGVFQDAQTEAVEHVLGREAPELLATHQEAKSAWKAASQLKDKLDSIIHVPGGNSIGSFLKNLKELSTTDGEKIFNRLGGGKNVDLLNVLKENFPQTAEALRQSELDALLSKASSKARPNEVVNPKYILSSIEKMSPEQRAFVVGENLPKTQAIGEILSKFDSMPWNTSKTAPTLDALWKNLPGGAAGMAGLLFSHNPIVASVLYGMTKLLSRDAPEAISLAMLKFLGSDKAIEANGFKSMVDFIHHTIQGENLISKATTNIFKAGREVLPQSFWPDDKSLKKLDKKLEESQRNPQSLMDVGGHIGDYMPDHAQHLAQVAANATQYLNSLRPTSFRPAPLDKEIEPNAEQKAKYNQALTIAEQPLTVMTKIKDGTLTSQDVMHLNNLYPGLYAGLKEKLMDNLIKSQSEDDNMPYKTKISLSLFMGQPLDSTMTPQILQATQIQPPQQQAQQPQNTKHGTKQLTKLPDNYLTKDQALESKKQS